MNISMLNSDLAQTNLNLNGLSFYLQQVSKTRSSDTYPQVIQVAVADAQNKIIFITQGTGNTVNIPHINRVDKYENVINITFAEELKADTIYYLDLLIVAKTN